MAQYAEFTTELITGNQLIDSQHKELIGKMNDLIRVCEEGDGKLKAVKTLNYLEDYTNFHFSQEEALQEQVGYPGLVQHKEKHQEFINTVKELFEMLEEEEGPTDAFVAQVNKNVIEWFYRHIQGFDRSVAEYIHLKNNPDLL